VRAPSFLRTFLILENPCSPWVRGARRDRDHRIAIVGVAYIQQGHRVAYGDIEPFLWAIVPEMLGNANTLQTMDSYSHLMNGMGNDPVGGLDEAFV
jgi:hypothetical protein